ncbi:MAG: HypC/HybG/HupF family hydrogenase formation chaperone [Candidatus Parcubacteria bacterium]|nr:HypC/HybG/HupF family hydrogenase formation chaperone [Candidatus Parcubacteria bacterium]
MCLSIPYKINNIKGQKAVVNSANKREIEIDLSLLKNLKKGDWILVLNNMAIQKITNKEAKQIINLYNYEKNK